MTRRDDFGGLSPDTTLEEAREYLRERVKKGTACPLCLQLAKVYRRPINAAMALWLITLVKLHSRRDGEWIHVADIISSITEGKAVTKTAGGDFAKLIYWELIESRPNADDPTKRESGYWRPTQKGIDFVRARVKLPSHAEVFDGRCLRLDDSKQVSIRDALGKKFNYAELMRDIATSDFDD